MAATGVNVLATRATHEQFSGCRRRSGAARHLPRSHCRMHHSNQNPAHIRSRPRRHSLRSEPATCPSPKKPRKSPPSSWANTIELIADVGVAGLHRLLAQRTLLQQATVLIVCAGMEGIICPRSSAALVAAPVIAVPTSIGYGASFGGPAVLLGMLNSCSPNVSVVIISITDSAPPTLLTLPPINQTRNS